MFLVADGALVGATEHVMMLEVMKMQTYVEAPTSGRIHFKCRLGDTVASGDILATIEKEDEHDRS